MVDFVWFPKLLFEPEEFAVAIEFEDEDGDDALLDMKNFRPFSEGGWFKLKSETNMI